MDIQKILDGLGIRYKTIDHKPVYTVAESLAEMPDKFPVKNLLLKEEKGDRCVFVIMKGDERLDTKLVASKLGTRKLQFAKPEVLMAKLGVEPGSASLFSLLHEESSDVEVVIDSRLLDQEELGFHPSVNTQTIVISGEDVETFLSSVNREWHEIRL